MAEVVERARRQEVVDIRQRRLQAARERCVIGGADQRVQPDQPVAAALQARDLIAEHGRLAAIPPV